MGLLLKFVVAVEWFGLELRTVLALIQALDLQPVAVVQCYYQMKLAEYIPVQMIQPLVK